MRTTTCSGLLILLAFGLASCAKQDRLSRAPAHVEEAVQAGKAGPFVVLGHLEHRDHVVTISAGENGPIYSARARDGKILFENLTAEQLKTRSPEIHDFIEAATAGHAGIGVPNLKEGRRLDATR